MRYFALQWLVKWYNISFLQEENNFPVSHKLIQSALKRQNIEWFEKHHQWKMSKRNIPSKLYRKSAVLAILPVTLDARGECEIEWETWIKLDSISKSESLSYKTLMTLIEKQSPEWMIQNHNGRMAQARTGLCAIYKKTALKSILPVKLDANGEWIINGEVWISIKGLTKIYQLTEKTLWFHTGKQTAQWTMENCKEGKGKTESNLVNIYRKSSIEAVMASRRIREASED